MIYLARPHGIVSIHGSQIEKIDWLFFSAFCLVFPSHCHRFIRLATWQALYTFSPPPPFIGKILMNISASRLGSKIDFFFVRIEKKAAGECRCPLVVTGGDEKPRLPTTRTRWRSTGSSKHTDFNALHERTNRQ